LEETHVAPRLDKKLQALGAGFSVSSKDDVFNALLGMSTSDLRTKAKAIVRSETQTTIDADNEETQLHTVDIHDEEDDE